MDDGAGKKDKRDRRHSDTFVAEKEEKCAVDGFREPLGQDPKTKYLKSDEKEKGEHKISIL
jgi:hypothetical protein